MEGRYFLKVLGDEKLGKISLGNTNIHVYKARKYYVEELDRARGRYWKKVGMEEHEV